MSVLAPHWKTQAVLVLERTTYQVASPVERRQCRSSHRHRSQLGRGCLYSRPTGRPRRYWYSSARHTRLPSPVERRQCRSFHRHRSQLGQGGPYLRPTGSCTPGGLKPARTMCPWKGERPQRRFSHRRRSHRLRKCRCLPPIGSRGPLGRELMAGLYQVPFDGRSTVMSTLESPSKSPETIGATRTIQLT